MKIETTPLSNFGIDDSILAHSPDETLEEHSNLTLSYFLKFIQDKHLDTLIDKIISKIDIQNSKLIKEMFVDAIYLHDLGKCNPYFQAKKMNNPKEQLISGDLTIKQSMAYIDKRLIIAKAIVQGIADNIREVLYHYYRHGKKELKPFLDWLKDDVSEFLAKEPDIKQILWIEGQIWNQFYDSFRIFLPEDFVMNKRVKRPPDNPINALVSFGNTLLYTKTISAIYHTHLNQSISFLHSPREGRFSLSLDLSEVFKPIVVFKTIFDLVNNKKLQVA